MLNTVWMDFFLKWIRGNSRKDRARNEDALNEFGVSLGIEDLYDKVICIKMV